MVSILSDPSLDRCGLPLFESEMPPSKDLKLSSESDPQLIPESIVAMNPNTSNAHLALRVKFWRGQSNDNAANGASKQRGYTAKTSEGAAYGQQCLGGLRPPRHCCPYAAPSSVSAVYPLAFRLHSRIVPLHGVLASDPDSARKPPRPM